MPFSTYAGIYFIDLRRLTELGPLLIEEPLPKSEQALFAINSICLDQVQRPICSIKRNSMLRLQSAWN
jgi:hypothetical protein